MAHSRQSRVRALALASLVALVAACRSGADGASPPVSETARRRDALHTGTSSWTAPPGPSARGYAAVGATSSDVVLFGGMTRANEMVNDLWRYGGDPFSWTQVTNAGLAPDASGATVAVFDGSILVLTNAGETWELLEDGVWTKREVTNGPSGRWGATMARRSQYQAVLFGGQDSEGGYPTDTWQWDVRTGEWQLIGHVERPTGRSYHAMAANTATEEVLLFGGEDENAALLGDTWVLNANNYWSRSAGAAPPVRKQAGLAFTAFESGRKAMLFGGETEDGVVLGDVWLWNGDVWTQDGEEGAPSPRYNFAMAGLPDLGLIVVSQGFTGSRDIGDTWIYNGLRWERTVPDGRPSTGTDGIAASFGDTAVVFSGSRSGHDDAQTWVSDGSHARTGGIGWALQAPPQTPPWRGRGAMAELGGRLYLFGGLDEARGSYGDTWAWDGRTWTPVETAHSPGNRHGHAMATLGDKIVLFGGSPMGTGDVGGMWTFDGQDWTAVELASGPAPRIGHSMTTFGDRIVLWGGSDRGDEDLKETWEWDGSTWTRKTSGEDVAPGDASAALVTYEGEVLALGDDGLWSWDGSAWTRREVAGEPPSDPWSRTLVRAGGRVLANLVFTNAGVAETWSFVTQYAQGEACSFHAQCQSGSCVDGLCCNQSCGDGATDDCLACSKAAGAAVDGECSVVAAGWICREGTDVCDVPETCDGTREACPEDVVYAVGRECRAPAGDCDVAETCTGESKACPADAFSEAGSACGEASCSAGGAVAGACSGSSAQCVLSEPVDCAPFACGGTACLTRCDGDEDCVGGTVCREAECVAPAETPDAGSGGPDAGAGANGQDDSGCGCASFGADGLLLAGLGLLARLGRRRRA